MADSANKPVNQSTGDVKVMAALAYFGILFFLPLVTHPNSRFGKFHANQGLLLLIYSMVGSTVSAIIPVLGWFILWPIIGISSLVFFIMGIVNALGNKTSRLPLIGQWDIIKSSEGEVVATSSPAAAVGSAGVENTGDPSDISPSDPQNNQSNKKVLTVVLVVVGILILLGIIGTMFVGFMATQLAERGLRTITDEQVEIDTTEGHTRIKGDDGKSMDIRSGSADLPNDFPRTVPIYPNTTLLTSNRYVEDGKVSFMVNFVTKDNYKDVFDFYKKQISEENGYKVQSTMEIDKSFYISGINDAEGYGAAASIGGDDEDGVSISIAISFLDEEGY